MKGQTMTQNPYPIGTKLNLIPDTSLWGQAHVKGQPDAIFEVVAQIDSPFGLPLIRVRNLDEEAPNRFAQYAALFEPLRSTPGLRYP